MKEKKLSKENEKGERERVSEEKILKFN